MNPVRAWRAVRQGAREFAEAVPFEKAAAVSYYALLAMAPLVLVVIAIAGLIFEKETVRGRMVEELRRRRLTRYL